MRKIFDFSTNPVQCGLVVIYDFHLSILHLATPSGAWLLASILCGQLIELSMENTDSATQLSIVLPLLNCVASSHAFKTKAKMALKLRRITL